MLCSLMGTESRLLCNQMAYSHAIKCGLWPGPIANEIVLDCGLTELLERALLGESVCALLRPSLRDPLNSVAVDMF